MSIAPTDYISEEYTENREDRLRDESRLIRKQYNYRKRLNRYYVLFGVIMVIIAPIHYFAFDHTWYASIWLVYAVALLAQPVVRPISDYLNQLKSVDNEIELLRVDATPSERRAEKLFRAHQIELKKYYDQTLKHSAWIFIIGIVCIVIGFGVVVWALIIVQSAHGGSTQWVDKVIVGGLGAVGGILANFIAVMYLKMYSETIKSLTEFHNRLVTTHHLHFANLVTSKVTNVELKEETMSKMAECIANQKT